MPKKEKQLPGSHFTQSETNYIAIAVKRIPFPVNYRTGADIYVPDDHTITDDEQLVIDHLENKFGFQVQRTDVKNVRSVFSPEMKTKFLKQIDLEESIKEVKKEIKVGTNFKDNRENVEKRIFSQTSDSWVIMVLGSMKPNYNMSKISFDIAIKNEIFTLK